MSNEAVTMSSRPMPAMQLPSLRISLFHMTFAVRFMLVGRGIIALSGQRENR